VVVVAYDSGDALTRCLESLAGEDVVVVNNGPPVDVANARTLDVGENIGFGAACNRGAGETDAEVLVFVNPDTVVRPGAIAALVRTLADPAIGVAQARLRLLDEPDLLNSSGNVVHVTGLAWPGGYRDRADSIVGVRDIGYASGAAFAVRSDVFREVGGFTEELFLYQEDLELCWRVRLHGHRVVVAPDADVLHDYVLARPGRRKEYFLERNRLVFVLTAYSARLLVLLAPVLLAAEVGVAVLAWRQGWLREKIAGWRWLACHARWLGGRRRATQALRRVPDRELARHLTPVLDPRMLELPAAARLANGLVSAWWHAVRVLL
jgi:GT2 family glycosyltransferase